MEKTAFLVLDMQNEMADPKGKVGAHGTAKMIQERGLVENIRRVMDAMRAKSQPVAFVRVGYRADYADVLSRSARIGNLKKSGACVLPSWGTEIIEPLKPLEGEMIFTKRAVNPFHNTQLANWLHRNGVTTIALAGVYTHMVVDSAARHGDDSGFVVKVLEDCCASPDPELHRYEIEKILPLFSTVTSSREFIAGL